MQDMWREKQLPRQAGMQLRKLGGVTSMRRSVLGQQHPHLFTIRNALVKSARSLCRTSQPYSNRCRHNSRRGEHPRQSTPMPQKEGQKYCGGEHGKQMVNWQHICIVLAEPKAEQQGRHDNSGREPSAAAQLRTDASRRRTTRGVPAASLGGGGSAPSSSLNIATASDKLTACRCKLDAALAACSTSASFCCVT